MKSDELRALQAPLKTKYRDNPASAQGVMRATGTLSAEGVTCTVKTFTGTVEAGLHPATGGDGRSACSGDMLLEALAGCAGVTLRAVATAMDIPLRGGSVTVEADLDFRGTLGVEKTAPVGFKAIRLRFDLDTDANPQQIEKLLQLTERYCVVYQTLAHPPVLSSSAARC